MIKTPVSYDENELIYYPQIHDVDGDYLFEAMDTDTAKEIVKEVKDSNSFTIIEGYPVNAAYLSNNGKYLMIYNDTKIDKDNPKKDSNEYKARENAVEDFLAFKN